MNVCPIHQHPERAVPEETAEILAAGHVAHVGFVQNGQSYVIPFSYQYDPASPELLYLHGGKRSRALRELGTGSPVCVTVTLVDGLVYSRSAMFHSMNYRSAVCFGRSRVVDSPEEKERVFTAMISRYFPGRTAGQDYEAATAAQLEATEVIAVEIDEWSAKARRGGPRGPLDSLDNTAPGTRGVVDPR